MEHEITEDWGGILATEREKAKEEERKKIAEIIRSEKEIYKQVLRKATMQGSKDIYEEKIETCDNLLDTLTALTPTK